MSSLICKLCSKEFDDIGNLFSHRCEYYAKWVTETFTATEPCKHKNGWFRYIPSRWWGKKRVFVCTDCGCILTTDKKEEI